MTDYAPAPWSHEYSVRAGGSGDHNLYIIDKNKRKIAAVWGKRGEKQATAAMMVAAPDLLTLAIIIRNNIKVERVTMPPTLIEALDKAIALASPQP